MTFNHFAVTTCDIPISIQPPTWKMENPENDFAGSSFTIFHSEFLNKNTSTKSVNLSIFIHATCSYILKDIQKHMLLKIMFVLRYVCFY